MSGAGGGARRTTAQVFAAGQNERMHIARFASGPDPGLARAEVRASMVRDDKAVMRRARGGAPEPERPWLLTTTTTERTTPERTYVGSLEEAQCNKYVLLVPDGDSFKMIPCREWYTYVTRPSQIAKLKQGDSEEKQKEAEERMRMRNRKGDQYLERRMATGAVDGEEGGGRKLRITGDGADDSSDGGGGLDDADRNGDAQASDDGGGVGAGDDDDDVYGQGADLQDAAWLNAGLEAEMGEEVDKGEDLDLDDAAVSDDDGDDGRIGQEGDEDEEEEEADAAEAPPALGDAAAAAGAAGAGGAGVEGGWQEVEQDEGEEEEEGGEEDEEEWAVTAAGGLGGAAAAGDAASAGKRARAALEGGASARGAAGSAAAPDSSAKRPRGPEALDSYLGVRESDLVELLRAPGPPLTLADFTAKVHAELGLDARQRTKEFQAWLHAAMARIAMLIDYKGAKVLVLKDEFARP